MGWLLYFGGAVAATFVFSVVVTYRGGRMLDHPEVVAMMFWPLAVPVMLALYGGPALGRYLREAGERRRLAEALRLAELRRAERELDALLAERSEATPAVAIPAAPSRKEV